MEIFRPEEFGAIADGIHNDATALWSAIAAACEYDGEAQVLLEAGKTYYIAPTEDQKSGKDPMKIGGVKQYASSMNCTAAIPIADAKDVHIKGKKSLAKIAVAIEIETDNGKQIFLFNSLR